MSDFTKFVELAASHPGAAIFVAVTAVVVFIVKQDLLGFGARSRRRRRQDLFDTYEKLDAAADPSNFSNIGDSLRTTLLSELREAGEGLPSAPSEPEDLQPNGTPEKALGPRLHLLDRLADRALFGIFAAGCAIAIVAMFIVGVRVALDGDVILGASTSGFFAWCAMFFFVRPAAERYPVELAPLARAIEAWDDRTKRARVFLRKASWLLMCAAVPGLLLSVTIDVGRGATSTIGRAVTWTIGLLSMLLFVKLATTVVKRLYCAKSEGGEAVLD